MKYPTLWLSLLVALLFVGGAYVLFRDPGPPEKLVADAADKTQTARGAKAYTEFCAQCHGAKLEGQPNWRRRLPEGGLPAPPHDASGHTWHHPDLHLFDYTKKGGQAMVPSSFKSNMPGFAEHMSDAEIWAVLAFIKSQWPAKIQRRQAGINRQYER